MCVEAAVVWRYLQAAAGRAAGYGTAQYSKAVPWGAERVQKGRRKRATGRWWGMENWGIRGWGTEEEEEEGAAMQATGSLMYIIQ